MNEPVEDIIYNDSAVHEKAVDFFDRRIKQLSEQYRMKTGKSSFIVRVPTNEGYDCWYFSDGKIFRNGFSALDHQYMMMGMVGMTEFHE